MVITNVAIPTARYTYALELVANAESSLLWVLAEVEAPYYGYIAEKPVALPLMGDNLPTMNDITRVCREALIAAYREVTREAPRNLVSITALAEKAADEMAALIAFAVTEGELPATILNEPSPCTAIAWLVMR